MKKIIIITGFLAFGCLAYGQTFNACANPLNAFYSPPNNGSVAIGAANPAYRLDVSETDANPGAITGNFSYSSNSTGSQASALRGYAISGAGNIKTNIGVDAEGAGGSTSNNSALTYGMRGKAAGGGINYGGFFEGATSTNGTTGQNIGVYGLVSGNGGKINAGVFGDDGGLSGTDAGYFSGNLRAVATSAGANANLILDNLSNSWSLQALGTGNFQVLNNTSGNTSMVIDQTTDYVGIGTTSAPVARLDVFESSVSATSAGNFLFASSIAGTCKGIVGTADQATTNNYGVHGTIGGTPGSGNNAGVFGDGSSSAPTSGINAGVYGKINSNGGGATDAGIYGEDNAGLGLAGYFNGDVTINGVGTIPGGVWVNSDRRYKKDIAVLENVVEKIQKLNGYQYNYRTDEFKDIRFDKRTHIGFIAQELKDIFPELVREDSKGYFSVDYQGMVPVLLEAVKDQQKKLDALALILQKQNENKEGNTTGIGLNTTVYPGFGLEQNIPNPYTHETLINYSLPEQTNQAYIAVYDLSGKQLASFQLTQLGKSSITITSEKLAAGIYIYSIIADGKVLDSKRMVIADK